MLAARSALVVGGSGALGRAVISRFGRIAKADGEEWTTTNIDLSPNKEATNNCILKPTDSWSEQMDSITAQLNSEVASFDTVIHVAGGFAPGGLKDGVSAVEDMYTMNIQSAFTAASLCSVFGKPTGLLVLTGSDGVMCGGTSFGIGYGMSKAATHHLAKSIQGSDQLPEETKTVCILPTTIDTVSNREAMPDGDFDTWISPDALAEQLVDWSVNRNNIPESLFVRVFSSTVDDGPYLSSDHIAVLNVQADE